MNKDLTVGKPYTVVWQFCLPLFGSIIFQQLYNLADSFVAGKFIGNDALAAVGNSYEITLIFLAFAFGCNIGCSVITSQLFGAKRYKEMKTAVYTTLISGGVLCLLLMLFGLIFSKNLLTLINTPENIFSDSRLYLLIYIIGLPFVFYYNIASGIFSALGDSKTPFIFLACSSVSNIAADILFVAGFKMGVSGVAWATFICQGVSSILAMAVVFGKLNNIKTDEKPNIFSFGLFKKISAIAVPSILQQSFVSVGNIIIQSVINNFGSAVIAGYSASVKLNNLVITSFTTLANGISNYTAQNLGARKYSRIKEGFKSGVKLTWIICAPIVLLYLIAGRYLMYFFLESPTGKAVDVGILFLRILAPFYFIAAAKLISDGTLRGAGRIKPFVLGTFTDLIIRVVLTLILSATALGSTGIWISWPIGWTVSCVISVGFSLKYMSKLKQKSAFDIAV